ncbi:MAG: glycosyltransferase family 2 protein [Bacillota bacterium]
MKTAAIIPAYNEAKTIGSVLNILKDCQLVDQVIVVSDGSTDSTVHEALIFDDVEVIELLENRGKGGAIKAGLDHTTAKILLFLDADLIGLTTEHVNALIRPVLDGTVPMAVGVFEKGRVATDIAQKMAPFLSGQRAVRRELLECISDLDLSRFGAEVALHRYVEEHKVEVTVVQLPDLSHLMKEEKLGFWKGLGARAKMYWEIFKYAAKINPHPKN